MKHSVLFLSAFILLIPAFGVSQNTATNDTSATAKKSRRVLIPSGAAGILKAQTEAEKARLQAEAAMQSAEIEAQVQAQVAASMSVLNEVLPQALEQVGPAVEQAMQALEFSMHALQYVDWPEANTAVQDALQDLPAKLSPLPPLPPLPHIPPIPAIAPMVPLPPLPYLPPIPNAPLPAKGVCWNFAIQEYVENLTDDEQVRIQALGALLSRDENAALPEIKHLGRKHENWAMRAAAVSLLAAAESHETLAILDEVLSKDTDHRVRLAAVRALSYRSEPEAREILKRLLLK